MDINKVLEGLAIVCALCFVIQLGKVDFIELLPLLMGICLPMIYKLTEKEKKEGENCKEQ